MGSNVLPSCAWFVLVFGIWVSHTQPSTVIVVEHINEGLVMSEDLDRLTNETETIFFIVIFGTGSISKSRLEAYMQSCRQTPLPKMKK